MKECYQIEWNAKIKEQTIKLKRKYCIKLPDAIIAATGLVNDIPLVTADKAFSKVEELDWVLLEI